MWRTHSSVQRSHSCERLSGPHFAILVSPCGLYWSQPHTLTTKPSSPQAPEAELREAARILGAHRVDMLSYEDQRLESAPIDNVRLELVTAIRRAKPQLVITFDPHGANRHPDHMAISRFVSDAVSAAADPRWYPDTGPAHQIERLLWPYPMLAFELARTADLANRPGIDFLIDTSAFWEKKQAAITAHRTQLPGLRKLFFDKGDVTKTLSVEAFRLGWGQRPDPAPAGDFYCT